MDENERYKLRLKFGSTPATIVDDCFPYFCYSATTNHSTAAVTIEFLSSAVWKGEISIVSYPFFSLIHRRALYDLQFIIFLNWIHVLCLVWIVESWVSTGWSKRWTVESDWDLQSLLPSNLYSSFISYQFVSSLNEYVLFYILLIEIDIVHQDLVICYGLRVYFSSDKLKLKLTFLHMHKKYSIMDLSITSTVSYVCTL